VFISAYTAGLNAAAGGLEASEIAVFVTGHALITVRKDAGFDIGKVTARWDASPDLVSHGIGFLLYGLLDVLVDGHFATVQRLDDSTEELQDLLFRKYGTAEVSVITVAIFPQHSGPRPTLALQRRPQADPRRAARHLRGAQGPRRAPADRAAHARGRQFPDAP
jgi:Mg2+ and Co2+ transporter CorA